MEMLENWIVIKNTFADRSDDLLRLDLSAVHVFSHFLRMLTQIALRRKQFVVFSIMLTKFHEKFFYNYNGGFSSLAILRCSVKSEVI
jgi:hypothetical protein